MTVLEQLQGDVLGWAHLASALLALAAGLWVTLKRKGGRLHRWIGRIYLLAMLALNGTALMIYDLFGGFGPFHWMALASLVSVLGGYLAARRRLPGWPYRHAYFMTGSYVGLVAAAVAETASRVPGWPFGPSVAISSVLIIAAGLVLMFWLVPRSLRRRQPQ